MLTDFKGMAYSGSLTKFNGVSYTGNLTDFKGNLIDGGVLPPLETDGLSAGWYPNYVAAKQWLATRSGVKGVIVTDTHYGASRRQKGVTYSQSIRSVKKIQDELDDVLFLHLGDMLDDTLTDFGYITGDRGADHSDRSMYLIGNHELQSGTSADKAALRAAYMDLMDGNSVTKVSDAAFYKDFGGVRFIAINNSSSYLTDVQTALDAEPVPNYYVLLSHHTPWITTWEGKTWRTSPALSGTNNLHAAVLAKGAEKFIGHWTGHVHHDGYEPYDPSGTGQATSIATFCCDYCSQDYTSWREVGTSTEGCMTCFSIDIDNHTVEFKRFGGIRPDDNVNINYNHWSYNWITSVAETVSD